jgi:hypothetical protein
MRASASLSGVWNQMSEDPPSPLHDPVSPPEQDPPAKPFQDPPGDPTYEPPQPVPPPTPHPAGDPPPEMPRSELHQMMADEFLRRVYCARSPYYYATGLR